jgi:AraC-like DNA-binding protein
MTDKKIRNDMVDFSIRSTFEDVPEYQLHCHGFYEIYYFISGCVEYMVEGKHYELKPGTILLFRPNLVHGVKVDKTSLYTRYAFHFLPEYVPKEHRDVLLAPFLEENVLYENPGIEQWFDRVLDTAELPKEVREIAVISRFESLLTELYGLKSHSVDGEKTLLSDGVVAYINEHITEDISLDDIAKKFYISKSQLGRIFKRSMDTTVWNYISLKRANIARQLIYRGESAESAATAAGFGDYSTFYRTYKKVTGHSPTETSSLLTFAGGTYEPN